MTKKEYDKVNTFPVRLVSEVPYEAGGIKLKVDDEFVAVRKEYLGGGDDYSFIDSNGYPHHYKGCELLFKLYKDGVQL